MNDNKLLDTIIFDAGGVLFYINEYRNPIIKRILLSLGYEEVLIDNAIKFVKEFDIKYFNDNKDICTWEDEKKWLEKRSSVVANKVDYGNLELADRLKYLSFDTFQYQLFDETIEVLNRLKSKYKLCVLSNATASLDWAFDNLDIRSYFDEVIISSYEGYAKPNEKLYKIALDKIGKKSNQCVFIDDKIENIVSANKLGIESYHLDRSKNKTLLDFENYLSEK